MKPFDVSEVTALLTQRRTCHRYDRKLRSPALASKNAGRPIKFEFQVNKESLFHVSNVPCNIQNILILKIYFYPATLSDAMQPTHCIT